MTDLPPARGRHSTKSMEMSVQTDGISAAAEAYRQGEGVESCSADRPHSREQILAPHAEHGERENWRGDAVGSFVPPHDPPHAWPPGWTATGATSPASTHGDSTGVYCPPQTTILLAARN